MHNFFEKIDNSEIYIETINGGFTTNFKSSESI